MKKILFFIAIASFSTIGFSSCSEDETVMEIPSPNVNPNVGEQLKVTANANYNAEKKRYEIQLGGVVKFTTRSGSNVISDATYYADGIKIVGDTYTSKTISNTKIQAKRAGYVDSEYIIVQYAQKPFN